MPLLLYLHLPPGRSSVDVLLNHHVMHGGQRSCAGHKRGKGDLQVALAFTEEGTHSARYHSFPEQQYTGDLATHQHQQRGMPYVTEGVYGSSLPELIIRTMVVSIMSNSPQDHLQHLPWDVPQVGATTLLANLTFEWRFLVCSLSETPRLAVTW